MCTQQSSCLKQPFKYKFFFCTVDAIYEGVQKRLFPSTIAIAIFSLPFLLELILLQYWNIGSVDQSQDDCEDSMESDCLKQTEIDNK